MREIKNINSAHLSYLTPLLNWRVLDLKSLREENMNVIGYKNFHRIIRSLEKQNILEGYLDPLSRKKFVYLSTFGERELSITENPTTISKETIIHDIKVSEITRSMLENGFVEKVELEHQLNQNESFKQDQRIVPDALLYVDKNNHEYHIAFELELNRKNNQRIIEKIKLYDHSNFYHYVMYVFKTENIRNQYMNLINTTFGDDTMKKIIFLYHPSISTNPSDLKNMEGYIGNKKINIEQVFK
jgi:hypothetical protein